jgi:twitching motility protein PilJ
MNVFLDLLKNFISKRANWAVIPLGLFFTIAVLNFVLLGAQSEKNAKYASHTAELRVLAQGIAKNASEAAAGNEAAFSALASNQKGFTNRFNLLKNGDGGSSVFSAQDLSPLLAVWTEVNGIVDTVTSNEDAVIEFREASDAFKESVPALQKAYDTIVAELIKNGSAPSQVAEAQKQIWRAERIASGASNVLSGVGDSTKAVQQLQSDITRFNRVNRGFLNGDSGIRITRVGAARARAQLAKVSKELAPLKENLDLALENAEQLAGVGQAASQIFVSSRNLLEESSKLNTSIVTKTAATKFPSAPAGIFFIVLSVLSGGAFGFLYIMDARKRRVHVEQENVDNQEAIMRLLDELGDLADGDLTVQATVTEDFTGAIADSINYSIDQMRELVSSINQGAVEVSSAAQETQATAMHLAEASEHQAQEIAGASAAVNEMAVSIDQVSANAAESSQVAQRSVEIANKGSEVVQNTIKGMDTIREQIQDTSKRIKRLGESSQEIGDIVSLINDIADQTNILALNAAIQASMAGDAGRGFAVVADEVQRLAERASGATKQIEALVKTIQTDTNEAVISMENTTTEVVKGARLAEDAGVSLEEIESVSTNLADLIQNISNAARQQAASAGHISNTMNVIQEITSQTSAGTSATAKSIGNLAELAAQMRSSVAGFKLPDSA